MARGKRTLLQRVYSKPNLEKAWRGLNRSRPYSHGISNESIKDFDAVLHSNLRQIQQKLKSGSYAFSPVRGVTIPKKGKSSGFRPLRIAEIRDRVVLKAIANVIEPILVKRYKLNNQVSFAYRRHIGQRDAIQKMVQLFNDGKRIALKSDIIRFFDTVDRKILLSKYIFPVFYDNTINVLIEQGLNQEIGNRNELSEDEWIQFSSSEGGIPQGSALSPLLSNVYLSSFDKKMSSKHFGLIRYADDFIVMCESDKRAQEAYKTADEHLKNNLGLAIHEISEDPKSKTKILKPTQNPVEFLSVMFDGKKLWPSREKFNELKEKIREITEPGRHHDVIELLTKCKNLLVGWLAAFSYTDVDRYFKDIDELINRRLEFALHSMKWKLKNLEKTKEGKECLSAYQRKYSGLQTCEQIASSIRNNNGFRTINK